MQPSGEPSAESVVEPSGEPSGESSVGPSAEPSGESPVEPSGDSPVEPLGTALVPRPLDSAWQEDIIEIFSVPRLGPVADGLGLGLRTSLAFDLLSGFDLCVPATRALLWQILATRRPKAVVLSPPCTMFSSLQRTNWSRMDPVKRDLRMAAALAMWQFALDVAWYQVMHGGLFLVEHPATASSWELPQTSNVLHQYVSEVKIVKFDQCRFDLKSPLTKQPMKKRTKFMTNSPATIRRFGGVMCTCLKKHKIIMGHEGRYKLSTWCQTYPTKMCKEMVRALHEDF